MLKKFKFVIGSALAVLLILIISCEGNQNDCNVPCYNGSCVNNSCNCITGFEGDSCTIRTVSRFIGDWNAKDSCIALDFSYTVTIAASSSVANEILLTNFGQFGTSFVVTGKVSGFNIEIPNQIVQGITLNGAGILDTVIKEITLTYSAKDAFQNSDACKGVWKKK